MKSMLSLAEMLQTKVKGLNEWRPACEQEQKRKSPPRPKEIESALDAMYEAIGTDQLSCNQLAERMGWKIDVARHRVGLLVKQKRFKRTTGMMPFLIFRA